MHSARINSRTTGPWNISAVGPRFGSTKLAAGAPHIRAFCECVGVCAIRAALTLAVLSALLIIAARPAQAQTETTLYAFTGSDGSDPLSGLTFDGAGNLYGTDEGGGLYGYGTVFELSPNGSGGWNETTLYSFTGGADGARPSNCAVIFDRVGNLYGTAAWGGAYGYGVVFELSPVGTSWTETVLHNFDGGDGGGPENSLIMDPAGNLYGTTLYGAWGEYGGVFELSPSGSGWTERLIYSFPSDTAISAGLTMDAAGNIFGVGTSTVFELSPNGTGGWNPTVIHTFTGAPRDGSTPEGTLVLDQAGNLYGTTVYGGAENIGTVYKLSPVTSGKNNGKWTERILHSFRGGKEDGYEPWAGIVFDADGNIYGTTFFGGKFGDGTVYELVAPVGTSSYYRMKVLWSFNIYNGYCPSATPILNSAGNLYGTARGGWYPSGYDVAFEVTPGTTTTLTSSPNRSTYGQAVTFTALVTSSAGTPPDGETVTFEHGKTVLGTGVLSGGSASFTTSTLEVGTTTVTAVYGGDALFLGSKSNTVRQVVE